MQSPVILDNVDLENLWYILAECSSSSSYDSLSYEDICQVLLTKTWTLNLNLPCSRTPELAAEMCAEVCHVDCRPYFSGSTFLGLAKDCAGLVSCSSLFGYMMRRNSMLHVRYLLRQQDVGGTGSLNSRQLRNVLSDMMQSMEALGKSDLSWDLSTYLTFATARFESILGSRNRIKTRQILPSFLLSDFLELKLPLASLSRSNTMSLATFEALRGEFVALDANCKGFLSEAEFAGYQQGIFTPMCVSRLFELHGQQAERTGGVQFLGFAAFVEFVTAWDYRHLQGPCSYFFQFLDLQTAGSIAEEDLRCFLKDLCQAWPPHLQNMQPDVEEVLLEILDMLDINGLTTVSCKNFMASGVASLVIGILLNIQQFWEYDSREELMQTVSDAD